ncbi:MAG TPA: hypothetical protein V6C65_10040 [Allocoleopsis sp.]
MTPPQLLTTWKLKQRKRKRLKIPSPPATMTIAPTSPVDQLQEAYPIALYWDNEADCYQIELSAFAIEVQGTTDWVESAALAKLIHRLLITSYRILGRALPEL